MAAKSRGFFVNFTNIDANHSKPAGLTSLIFFWHDAAPDGVQICHPKFLFRRNAGN
jgi:hypothetical protein